MLVFFFCFFFILINTIPHNTFNPNLYEVRTIRNKDNLTFLSKCSNILSMVSNVEMNKIDKQLQKGLKRVKKIAVVISILLGLALTFMAFMRISAWYDQNKVSFQTPIIFRSPVVISKRDTKDVIVKAVQTRGSLDPQTGVVTAGMTQGQLAYEAYKTVRFRESTNGKEVGLNAYCVSRGLINEVGYNPQESQCFKDVHEQVATVTNWFRNCLEKKEIRACLLEYSGNSYGELGYQD